MKRLFSLLIGVAATICATAQTATSTRQTAENIWRANPPRLNFNAADMPADSFPKWQAEMSAAMAALMKHPSAQSAAPTLESSTRKEGYTLERWLSHPLEGSVVPFYVMIPDTLSGLSVLCIPGFGQTKELLISEGGQGWHLMRNGAIAVVVDNPSCGELNDGGVNDYVVSSRFLLEMGWSWLGLASWQDKVILDWMKTDPRINPDNIVVSGFSLGTEPLMVLGLLDPSIRGFVYNDFLCRTRERALTMNKRDANGFRGFPNNIEHLIPGFLAEFDFPDIVAALAPRPVICTEGGMDRDFRIIGEAFALAGAPEAFEAYHYPMYADPASRVQLEEMPNGVDRDEFFRLANVDPPHHGYKINLIAPWLKQFAEQGK